MRCGLFQIVALLAPSLAWGGSSASYSLEPLAVDGGGGTAASTHYTLDSSISPGSSGGSTSYGLRGGFAGQLVDLVGLAVEAAPLILDEGTSLQLGARLLFADATTLPLATSEVGWSVDSGPLSGISASGLATAATVYEDGLAVARGSLQSVSGTVGLTVLDVDPDNFGSYAGDGIDDDWQVGYFGVEHPDGAAGADPDGDSDDNYKEFLAGFDPTDPAEFLDVSVYDGGGGTVSVELNRAIPGRYYRLLRTVDLDGAWSEVLNFTVPLVEQAKLVQDTNPPEKWGFYRIEISKP